MKLTVITGGKSAEKEIAGIDLRKAVEAEVRRRLVISGFEQSRVRALMTGNPIPREMQYLEMQIRWVAEALFSCNPIPADYDSDKYWPTPG